MASEIQKDKLQIIEWIVSQDKLSALKPLKDAIAAMEKDKEDTNEIVGYLSHGVRVTRKQLVQTLLDSVNNLDEKSLIKLEEIEQQSDKW